MAEIRLLTVPEELVNKVDENRGELSRVEFLNLCIDEFLKEGREKAEEKEFVRREEFDEFKRYMRNVMETFIESKLGTESPKELPQLRRDELGKATSASYLPKEGSSFKDTYALWILGILLFGFGDTLTTYLSVAKGAVEANPILNLILGVFGVQGFVLVKTAIIVGLVLLSFLIVREHQLIIPSLLILVGMFLTVNNLVLLLA